MRRLAVPLALLSIVGFVPGIGRDNPLIQVMTLIARDDVKHALNYPDANRAPILDEWVKLTEINAPSGKERERAESIRRSLEPLHLNKIYYDAKGNLIAVRKGLGQSRAVVIDAHLDTVFKEGLKIKAQVRDGKVFAPGIGDDTRNLEAVLASIRALDEAGIKTIADLIFVFTVEGETSMDGARQFIAENKDRIGSYVALDGGYEGLTYGGIGINWYKHHFIGPGGHTRSSTP
ncbi:MAG TPA: M20/M25/M40 family metallo-hydrolase, partial [Blastocatellia bacterium]|nr:M20/M25/M40 family metallo-hydrolase [Blastocatellia bacterium]